MQFLIVVVFQLHLHKVMIVFSQAFFTLKDSKKKNIQINRSKQV